MRLQRESMRRRGNRGPGRKQGAQAADLHAQPRAVRFVVAAYVEGGGDQRIAWRGLRPCGGECAGECEQHRTSGQRQPGIGDAHAPAAAVDDQGVGGVQGFHLVQQQRARRVGFAQARDRLLQLCLQCGHFRLQGGDAGACSCGLRLRQRCPCGRGAHCAQRQFGGGEVGHGR